MTQELKARGMTDEQTTCDACGRIELRGTVILVDAESGEEIGRFGTSCASKKLGWSITRKDAVTIEAVRRQNVCDDLRKGLKAANAGDAATALWRVREARRWYGLVRADEIALATKIEGMCA
jgi:hypothetical protein